MRGPHGIAAIVSFLFLSFGVASRSKQVTPGVPSSSSPRPLSLMYVIVPDPRPTTVAGKIYHSYIFCIFGSPLFQLSKTMMVRDVTVSLSCSSIVY